jgi:hypothetical protein
MSKSAKSEGRKKGADQGQLWLRLLGLVREAVPSENSESIEKSSDLSCPAIVLRGCWHSVRSFFHGSLIGFAAARNWS